MAKELTLKRPLVAFDIETTGLDVQTDRIVEIACIKIHPEGSRQCMAQRINPLWPISPTATAVHGIRDSDVAMAPTFEQMAPALYDFLSPCDLTGFNIEQFDLPLLRREFERVGKVFPPSCTYVIDSWRIFSRHEPRDLRAAYQFYCGANLENAHTAMADATAAADILWAQIRQYPSLPTRVDILHAYCHPHRSDGLDPDGKSVWRKKDDPQT